MTLYRKTPTGNWYYDFVYNGTRYGKSCRTKDRAEAQVIENEVKKGLIFNIGKPKNADTGGRMTIKYAVSKIHMERYATTRTGERSMRQLQQALDLLPPGKMFLDEITREDFIEIRNKFIQQGNAHNTADKKLAPLKKLLNMASEDWAAITPLRGIKALKFKSKKRRHMEYQEEIQLYTYFLGLLAGDIKKKGVIYAKEFSVRAYLNMYVVYIETGIRCSELTDLLKDDITWAGHYITVGQKNYEERDVPTTPRCEEALRELCELFPNDKRVVPYRADVVSREMNLHIKAAGLNRLTLHCFRHTFCMRRIAEGVPTVVVKELAGHKSLSTTEKYCKVTMDTKQKALGNDPTILEGKCRDMGSEFWANSLQSMRTPEQNPQ